MASPLPMSAAIIAGLVGLGALVGVASEIPGMVAGCYGRTDGSVAAGDTCAAGATSEPLVEAIGRLILVNGAVVAAAAMAGWGMRNQDGRWFAGAGMLFGILTAPLLLGTLWVVSVLAAMLCFAASFETWPRAGRGQRRPMGA